MLNKNEKAQHHGVGDDVLLSMKHNEYKASIAYARGLFLFVSEFNLLGPIRKSFDKFINMWQKLPIMKRFVQCQAIDRYTRKDRIRYLFRNQVHRVFLYFIEKLIDNNHTDLLTGIYDIFCHMMDEINQKQKLRIISVFPLNRSQLVRLQKTLEDSLKLKVIIKNEVDPEILGGFVCFTDSIKIDMSLKKDLDKIKSKILSESCLGNKKFEINLSENIQKELGTSEKQLQIKEFVLS